MLEESELQMSNLFEHQLLHQLLHQLRTLGARGLQGRYSSPLEAVQGLFPVSISGPMKKSNVLSP